MPDLIHISNPGHLNPDMWQVFGVSAKESDHPIGEFGTGLKYAIAVCLRHHRHISIQTGGETYEFSTKPESHRGQKFHRVLCNNQPLPFTTHLGHKWELWMAYRELICNALDEGGGLGQDHADTVITAELGDIEHSDVFFTTTNSPLIKTQELDIYPGESTVVYARNIRVYDSPVPLKHTLNLKTPNLTEDRTLADLYETTGIYARTLIKNCTETLAKELLFNTKGFVEESMSWSYYGPILPVDHPLVHLAHNTILENKWHNTRLLDVILNYGEKPEIPKTDPTPDQLTQIKAAKDFLLKNGIKVDYPIFIASLPEGALGEAIKSEEVILLSPKLFTEGFSTQVKVILEEQLHIQYQVFDNSREMQNLLFDLLYHAFEQKHEESTWN